MRACGVLCPIFSLPSPYGIGTFGKSAYDFVDQLKEAKQTYWQILPLGQTGYGDSPYQSFSTFAGNPYFIDLDLLCEEQLLLKSECPTDKKFAHDNYVNYEQLYFTRYEILRKAFARFCAKDNEPYQQFVRANEFWLEDYALYMAIKDSESGHCFMEWPKPLRNRQPEALSEAKKKRKKEIEFYYFIQFYFFKQWFSLKQYANASGIKMIGDLPIYVAFDSADTWANPELFQLDEKGYPIAVAGCPPDGFSVTGQLWGNPLYRWEFHKETRYEWWMKRLKTCFEMFDVVRIDHFRGFESYYAVPYGHKTAEHGHWEEGPSYDLFQRMSEVFGRCHVIAEDLGFLTKDVIKLVKKTRYPGMKIIQFAFYNYEDNLYLPHNYKRNTVAYTGTHDNETLKGFLSNTTKHDMQFMKQYTGCRKKRDVGNALRRQILMSVANTVIVPIQDYLMLGNEARINTPSTLGDNWKWRLKPKQIDEKVIRKMRREACMSFRTKKNGKEA